MFLSGTWLFLGNMLIGYTWAKFLMAHMNIPFSGKRKKVYHAIGLVACILLIINIFYPLVFIQKDGIYQRGPAYSIFLIFAVFYIVDSLLLYGRHVKKNQYIQIVSSTLISDANHSRTGYTGSFL